MGSMSKAYNNAYYQRTKHERRQSIRENSEKRREDVRDKLWAYLQDSECADCHLANPLVLQFDHVRGEKVANVADLMNNHAWPAMLEEIAKCEVVCANCHIIRTAMRAESWRARRVGVGGNIPVL